MALNNGLRSEVLAAAQAQNWPEIPASAATGYCWLSAGETRWRLAVANTSPSVLRVWLSALLTRAGAFQN